eukprot:gene1856-1135_t
MMLEATNSISPPANYSMCQYTTFQTYIWDISNHNAKGYRTAGRKRYFGNTSALLDKIAQ